MEEWKEYTVQELIDKGMLAAPMDGNHGEKHPKTGDYVPTGIPFIMANNLIGGTVDYKNCAFISKTQANSLDKGFAKPGDVLLTHKATIGRTAIVPNDYDFIVLTPQVTYYRPLKGIDNRFLKYYFDTVQFQSLFKNWAGAGSTRAYLGITAQRKLPIVLPDIGTQKKITSILKSLDDEIEVNRRINDNLEQQAQALFKSWFVDFEPFKDGEFVYSELGMIPKGWRIGVIGDYCKVRSGYAFKSSWWSNSGVPVVKIKNITDDGRLDMTDSSCVSNEHADLAKDFQTKVGDLLIAMTGATIGKFCIVHSNNKICVNQRVGKFFLGDTPLKRLPFVYYNLKKPNVFEEIVLRGQGSAQPNISGKDIETISIVYPNEEIIAKFNILLYPLLEKVTCNLRESRRLATLRDTLLPKLMSGELKVNEIKE